MRSDVVRFGGEAAIALAALYQMVGFNSVVAHLALASPRSHARTGLRGGRRSGPHGDPVLMDTYQTLEPKWESRLCRVS